ncbi:MAG: redoxin domain-containing protein [Ktedonobacteraceae bacterium]
MSEQHQPFLQPGDIVPAFSLPGADGMPHSPWDYKQREHLVIILLSRVGTNEARGILKELKRQYSALREECCAVLAVAANTVIENLHAQEALQLPFALLADPRGEVIARYTYWDEPARQAQPSIVLADRYGTLYEQWIARNEAELPSIDILLKDLQYLNKLCTP